MTTLSPKTYKRIAKGKEIPALTGLSLTTVYRLIAAGLFPQPIRLAPNSVGWDVSEIEAWLEARKAERRRA